MTSVKVYAVRNRSSPDTYIGTSKKQYLSQRLAGHLYDLREHVKGNTRWVSSFQILRCPTAYIELLEECDEEVRKVRERWWVENTPNCVNIHYKPPTEEDITAKRQYDTERMRVWRAKQKSKF